VDPHGSPARVGRDGTLSLRFERRGGATVLAGCRFTLPLQVMTPLALADAGVATHGPACGGTARPCVVPVLNPTGCVLGGDRLRIDVSAEPGAHALLTTPSATKVHRSDGPPAVQEVGLTVASGAVLEWVPDHTIPHAGAAFRQCLRAHVATGATLIVVDAFAVGRVARGDRFGFRVLESALTVTDEAGWLLHDRFVLGAASGWAGLGFCEGAAYLATIAVVTPAPADAVARAAAEALGAVAGARGGVGRLPRRGVLVRCLAETAPALADAVRRVWDAVRGVAIGAAPLDLRKY
jgi:urease accessory protein